MQLSVMSLCNTFLQRRYAVEACAGQIDKTNEPYILHPLRVMLGVEGEVAEPWPKETGNATHETSPSPEQSLPAGAQATT